MRVCRGIALGHVRRQAWRGILLYGRWVLSNVLYSQCGGRCRCRNLIESDGDYYSTANELRIQQKHQRSQSY